MSYLYRHIRPDRQEVFYIGIGSEGTRRAWETRKRSQLWKSVVAKNKGVFKVDILLTGLTKEEAIAKEIEFIDLYGRRVNGCGSLVNFQAGGPYRTGYRMTETQKTALSIRARNNEYAKGFEWTPEMKEHASISRKGRPGPNKGRTFGAEVRAKMSKSHMGNRSTSGMIWISDGSKAKLIHADTSIPAGWVKGRLKKMSIL